MLSEFSVAIVFVTLRMQHARDEGNPGGFQFGSLPDPNIPNGTTERCLKGVSLRDKSKLRLMAERAAAHTPTTTDWYRVTPITIYPRAHHYNPTLS